VHAVLPDALALHRLELDHPVLRRLLADLPTDHDVVDYLGVSMDATPFTINMDGDWYTVWTADGTGKVKIVIDGVEVN
jgi:hypothetical protein